jgi:uncharacterized membrane protein YgdD (TMEM256/DUF423 family)
MKELIGKSLRATGISGALAVALGALGAHALKARLTPEMLSGFETGTRYHLVHVVAMLAVLLLRFHFESKFLRYAYTLFFWGVILFSGSLYLLCTRSLLGADWLRLLGPVTPLGGLCLIGGWFCICIAGLNKR